MMRLIILLLLTWGVFACQSESSTKNAEGAVNQSLPVDDFEQKLTNTPDVQLVDVRTPAEFAQEHLANAININIGAADFTEQINNLDKNKPVMIYCLSGVRSNRAARQMQQLGFKIIYDMQGGLMKWRAAGKAMNVNNSATKGMSIMNFNKAVNKSPYVLVDYNAKWCQPCRKMLPMIEDFVAQRQDKLALLQVDVDENKFIVQEKGIESIPFLELYQNGQLIWKYNGYMDAQTLAREVKL